MNESWQFERRVPGADVYRRNFPPLLLEVPDEVTSQIARRERTLMAQAFEKSVKNLTVAEIIELIKGL